nr:MAG TPA: tail protein [Caudoviricetes sp.]
MAQVTAQERYAAYLKALRGPFEKLCRLRFLNPDGSTAFFVDNNRKNPYSGAFVSSGTLTVNLQNGVRRTASVTLSNTGGEFAYDVNHIWFGQEIALDEGLTLPNGEEYYIQQGVFLVEDPEAIINPDQKTAVFNLVDKWANLDGTLWGNLDGTYRGALGVNIFQQVDALLQDDKGNGVPVDRMKPVYTEYYNGKTQELPDGTTANLVDAPYTLEVSPGSGGTYSSVILGFCEMLNAWVGYDATGRLRIDPSQDDLLDTEKPVAYAFSMDEVELLGLSYTAKNTEVYNDYIVMGEQLENNSQPGARATNNDPESDTNVNLIGRKTVWTAESGYTTDTQCRDKAEWMLKRSTVLQKSVDISCAQIFHIKENELVTIVRTDKPGSPTERHLIQGFSRPLAYAGEMTITAVSVADFPTATVTEWGKANEAEGGA